MTPILWRANSGHVLHLSAARFAGELLVRYGSKLVEANLHRPGYAAPARQTSSREPSRASNESARSALSMNGFGRRRVAGRILLVEPYQDIAEILGLYLEDLGYQFDLVTNTDVDEEYLASKSYDCVLVNIDQNSDSWRDAGLRLAEKASRLSVPVVMIADHAFAAQAATAKGWKPIQKPFTLERLRSAISQAVGVP
jgi:CheY-like chemotaxis protein